MSKTDDAVDKESVEYSRALGAALFEAVRVALSQHQWAKNPVPRSTDTGVEWKIPQRIQSAFANSKWQRIETLVAEQGAATDGQTATRFGRG